MSAISREYGPGGAVATNRSRYGRASTVCPRASAECRGCTAHPSWWDRYRRRASSRQRCVAMARLERDRRVPGVPLRGRGLARARDRIAARRPPDRPASRCTAPMFSWSIGFAGSIVRPRSNAAALRRVARPRGVGDAERVQRVESRLLPAAAFSSSVDRFAPAAGFGRGTSPSWISAPGGRAALERDAKRVDRRRCRRAPPVVERQVTRRRHHVRPSARARRGRARSRQPCALPRRAATASCII